MDPQVKSSLLWGLTGALTFLVLLQAYQLLTEGFVKVGIVAGVTAAVGVVTALAAHASKTWLRHAR